VNNHLHPIFQKILRAYAPATVEANSLSSDILDAIDGAEETRGRDSQLTQWADRAQAMQDALSANLTALCELERASLPWESLQIVQREIAKTRAAITRAKS
jgi:hypothetical protein